MFSNSKGPLRLPLAAALLSLTSFSAAQLIAENSFGTSSPLSPNGQNIPHWSLSSLNHNPHVLSDRVVLTPPLPGNARGALWGESAVTTQEWTADFEFRASGDELASGNLQLWYVQDKNSVGQNSIYTVERFDGLGIIIDQYAGKGGSIRGFLNDGTQNFNAHTGLESLAFGHCDYNYRNLGRPSKLTVSSGKGLSVYIDDKLCFSTEQIELPQGYYFGITAATSGNPDTTEAFKFSLTRGSRAAASSSNQQQQQQQQQQQNLQARQEAPAFERLSRLPGAPEMLPNQAADEIRSTDAQFADLHNRLQALGHQLADMNSQFQALGSKIDSRHNEVMGGMPTIPHDAINTLSRRVESIERSIQQVQRDVEGRDYKQSLNKLQDAVDHMRGGLTDALPDTLGQIINASAPRMGFFLFVVVAVQIMLAGAYILYKRRRASAPKKYL